MTVLDVDQYSLLIQVTISTHFFFLHLQQVEGSHILSRGTQLQHTPPVTT